LGKPDMVVEAALKLVYCNNVLRSHYKVAYEESK
jgi:hypothetical protein